MSSDGWKLRVCWVLVRDYRLSKILGTMKIQWQHIPDIWDQSLTSFSLVGTIFIFSTQRRDIVTQTEF